MKKNKFNDDKSMIGKIVDLPLEDFEKELVRQKVNIGTINNLILNLSGAYNELVVRKNNLIEMSLKDPDSKDEVERVIKGIYAEMIKIEQKVTYLKQRSKELVNVDEPQIDKK